MDKFTKKDMYSALINYATTGTMFYTSGSENVAINMADLRDFAQHEIDLLDKRAVKAKETSAAKRKADNDNLMAKVLNVVTDQFETAADIAARVTGEDVTVAKVINRLNKLVAAGQVEKTDMKIAATETSKARTVKGFKLAE